MAKNQIRWHARGGQGAKTAAGMVAEVAIAAGKNAQAAPEYGAEREGAPVKAYTRISDDPIRVHDAIYFPNVVVVLDETLMVSEDVQDGLEPDGALLVNTKRTPAQIRETLGMQGRHIYTIDATGIAIEEIGRPIPNTVMIGALLTVTGAAEVEQIEQSIHKKFDAKLSAAMLQGNINAVKRACTEIQSE